MNLVLPGHDAALRAEHDAIAARLAARRSIEQVRRGAWAAFLALTGAGLAFALAYTRWGATGPRGAQGPPTLFVLALVAALAGLSVAARAFAGARRLMRGEDRDFARLRELRVRLGLDP